MRPDAAGALDTNEATRPYTLVVPDVRERTAAEGERLVHLVVVAVQTSRAVECYAHDTLGVDRVSSDRPSSPPDCSPVRQECSPGLRTDLAARSL